VAIRVPPGRAGRLWLVRRLEVARRGADVLDQKRQTLLRERLALIERLTEAAADWERTAAAAARWNDRALALAGARRLRLASLHRRNRAEVTVEWHNALGTFFPAKATVRLGPEPDFVALGGGSGITHAAQAHAQALGAAARYAALRAAHEALTAELAATTRRLRAIERRWIPDHQAALRTLELTLEARELEDAIRVRWAAERRFSRLPLGGLPGKSDLDGQLLRGARNGEGPRR
jgi:V/A-type H+/Na+-transporting ATPase subunit D